MAKQNQSNKVVDKAIAEGGAYEVIRKRLTAQGQELKDLVQALNQSRLEEFGASDMSVVAQVRVRTDNNCIARDIVQVGDLLLFGYNVYIGLKKEVRTDDVFALFRLEQQQGQYALEPVELKDSFLHSSSFVGDFEELYRYYKHTKLMQLSFKDGKLLAAFQIGERLDDRRVFRWAVSADGKSVEYIDNRGERDIQLPSPYDFEWIETNRENFVLGRHSHVNILDTVFVETIDGDLTVKIENNTDQGLGIYSEAVEDDTQSMDDAQIFYAKVGDLILIKVLPYQETTWRYLVYNALTESVQRIDAVGESCVQLPEDHGIIFPGGYYLQSGENKLFEVDQSDLRFKRMIRSPNGEDVLYIFYEPEEGVLGLFSYNMITRELQNPIYAHGYATFDDGKIIIFSAEDEPTRIHPMQIWQTPYCSQEFSSAEQTSQTWMGKTGNAELVRGVSNLYAICRIIDDQEVSIRHYEELNQATARIFDTHYWLTQEPSAEIKATLDDVAATAELVVDEFEKVQSIQKQSQQALTEAVDNHRQIQQTIGTTSWEVAEDFVKAINVLREQRGHLATIREYRYMDVAKIAELDASLIESEKDVSEQTVAFMSQDDALHAYVDKIQSLDEQVESANSRLEMKPALEEIEASASGLDLLSELMTTLKVEDARLGTRIIESISEVYAKLNQVRAKAKQRQKNLGSEEAVAQFGAQFKLLTQSVTNSLNISETPEKCDEQLARLLVQLEELESQFNEYDQFLNDIFEKREEIYETFETRKQQLLDERQRRAQTVFDSASRIVDSIEKRSLMLTDIDKLNTYFASDAMVLKVRELVENLQSLDSAVSAGDIESRFKAVKDQAVRALRDKTDIYENDGSVIKLGPRHKFSVNTQEADLTIIPRQEELYFHIVGTDYYELVADERLRDLKSYWSMTIASENSDVYRSEYLAYQVLQLALRGEGAMSLADLHQAIEDPDAIGKLVRDFATPLYKEGYQKGVHDADAVLLLNAIVPAMVEADLLRFDPLTRGFAQYFWSCFAKQLDQNEIGIWIHQAQSAIEMQDSLKSQQALQLVQGHMQAAISLFLQDQEIQIDDLTQQRAARYLCLELARGELVFVQSMYAKQLVEKFNKSIGSKVKGNFAKASDNLMDFPARRWRLVQAWLTAFTEKGEFSELKRYVPEAIALIACGDLSRRLKKVEVEFDVTGLIGDHSRVVEQSLSMSLDDYLMRLHHHQQVTIAEYQRYLELRSHLMHEKREQMRLDSFKARPLSSFVRNRLINEAYLPIIGDNLAKQMGTIGDDKRSDLMGLLMMISPPGYGKTTLMEYVASRLGLVFMKINCPSLGHDVVSLDPEQAPHATARQELEKINLAFEMGSNVMLYLDDIQHTHPEFLQKYISLCDGTRRIDGVWQGETKTYDMRGKRFCVVMAGNPYTESGEMFKVPDMLANRADIYNLGDILGGMEEQFALSYIENCLTSNAVLSPLALRSMQDVYTLVRIAQGENLPTTDLSHQYSAAEINEITQVLQKLFQIQEVILKINQQYIASAAQGDQYRVEPPFKLQGSYRNMNKMAEKVSSVMNGQELNQLIDDHYLGESQLLTSGAEENLLKLAELRSTMSEEQLKRWQQIKDDFLRNKALGGDETNVGNKVVTQIMDLVSSVNALGTIFTQADKHGDLHKQQSQELAVLQRQEQAELLHEQNALQAKHVKNLVAAMNRISQNIEAQEVGDIEVVNQPVPGMDKILQVLADSIQNSILPLVVNMDKKLDIDKRNLQKIHDLANSFKELEAKLSIVPMKEAIRVSRKRKTKRKEPAKPDK